MSHQLFASRGAGPAMLAVALLVAGTVAGQSAASARKAWSPPRTPDGQPDLQGTWTNVTLTPFERPREFACHEGNRAMLNILSIARAAEKATPEGAKQGSK